MKRMDRDCPKHDVSPGVHPLVERAGTVALGGRKNSGILTSAPEVLRKEPSAIGSAKDRRKHAGGSKMAAQSPEMSTFVHFFRKAHASLYPLVLLEEAVIGDDYRRKAVKTHFLYLRRNRRIEIISERQKRPLSSTEPLLT
jgi:hypothetical protein